MLAKVMRFLWGPISLKKVLTGMTAAGERWQIKGEPRLLLICNPVQSVTAMLF